MNGLWHDHDKQECHTIVCRNDLWCNCDKQEGQGFFISSQVICDTSMKGVNVRVLLGECSIFELLLGILIYHLAENIPQKILKIHEIDRLYQEHNSYIFKYYP